MVKKMFALLALLFAVTSVTASDEPSSVESPDELGALIERLESAERAKSKERVSVNTWVKKHTSLRAKKVIAPAVIDYVYEVSEEKDLDPLLVLSVMHVESRFDLNARNRNSHGLLQVYSKVHRKIIRKYSKQFQGASIYDYRVNLQVGTDILKVALEGRSKRSALSRYNGSTRDRQYTYAKKVLAVYQKLTACISEGQCSPHIRKRAPRRH